MSVQNQTDEVFIAAVEGGGTSFLVAVAKLPSKKSSTAIPEILFRLEVDSSHDQPHRTLSECSEFFIQHKPKGGYSALGIATFGPVGLDSSKNTYGCILGSSPKQPWRNVDFLTPLANACRGSNHLAIKIETDVNAPAFAEYLQEKDRLSSVAYVTVGTGIGVGLVIHGQPVHGRMHPEGGHVPIHPLPGDKFEGYSWGEKSPFMGKRTVEGITSSVALTERLELISGEANISRSKLAGLSDDHEVWDHSANALASLCATLLLTTSVEKIVLGGGIMNRNSLIGKIQKRTIVLLNGYLELPNDLSTLICKSNYGNDVGIVGALVLAQSAYHESDLTKTLSQSEHNAFMAGFAHVIVATFGVGLAMFAIMQNRTRSQKS